MNESSKRPLYVPYFSAFNYTQREFLHTFLVLKELTRICLLDFMNLKILSVILFYGIKLLLILAGQAILHHWSQILKILTLTGRKKTNQTNILFDKNSLYILSRSLETIWRLYRNLRKSKFRTRKYDIRLPCALYQYIILC